ncbi:hypothetical protein PVAND_002717 [Polypedilum vanderplanki]|uniref:Metallo-beta-lactamase domain-containing protein 1 n=1 Tax=Polypedilum vanderplanki TaxID=319348 RepID=A0A9J6BS84_POLVA|nr:hypothetical protein PVAND_002717 [Polypedilum vanderplanki]
MNHQNHIIELFAGFSTNNKEKREMKANCTVTLIKGENKIVLVDTMTAWDKDVLLKELKFHHVAPEDVDYLVCTHGHSDHCGNMNLFLKATHFVGSCVSHKHMYYYHDFENNPYKLDNNIEVIFTPGHTSTCVSVIVKNTNLDHGRSVAIVGDLFEREEDIFDESLWIEAGTEDEKKQRINRLKIAEMVDFIIPGHGGRFAVTEEIRQKLREDIKQ